jgi:hypothetical protein
VDGEADEVKRINEGNNPIFGRDLYYICILGDLRTAGRLAGMSNF